MIDMFIDWYFDRVNKICGEYLVDMAHQQAGKDADLAINDVRKEIRAVNLQIKTFARSKRKVTVLNLDGTESEVDPIPELENKKHLLLQRFEQLNEGKSHKLSDQERIEDFLHFFFVEIEQREKNIEWISKFYHPNATMTWIEGAIQTKFETRDLIVDSYVRRYSDLIVKHSIRSVQMDVQTHPDSVLSGTISVAITIENDKPRLAKYMLEWSRAVESGLFDICILKEFFWTVDARPLYHWPEKLLPHEIRALQEAEERKKREEIEALQEQLRLAAEEKKKRKEAGEIVSDDDDDEEEEEDGDEEGEDEDDQKSQEKSKDNDDSKDEK